MDEKTEIKTNQNQQGVKEKSKKKTTLKEIVVIAIVTLLVLFVIYIISVGWKYKVLSQLGENEEKTRQSTNYYYSFVSVKSGGVE